MEWSRSTGLRTQRAATIGSGDAETSVSAGRGGPGSKAYLGLDVWVKEWLLEGVCADVEDERVAESLFWCYDVQAVLYHGHNRGNLRQGDEKGRLH